VAPAVTGMLPLDLVAITVVVGLVEILLGALLGARFYQEAGAPAAAAAR